jgi:hypothetical protein
MGAACPRFCLPACVQDYFRDFTQEDLRSLMPLLLDPRDDPALTVPAPAPVPPLPAWPHHSRCLAGRLVPACFCCAHHLRYVLVLTHSLAGWPPCSRVSVQVPPSGRRLEDEQQQRKHAAAKAAAAEAAKAAAAAASSRGEWDWDGGAVDSKPSPGLDGLSPDTEVRLQACMHVMI